MAEFTKEVHEQFVTKERDVMENTLHFYHKFNCITENLKRVRRRTMDQEYDGAKLLLRSVEPTIEEFKEKYPDSPEAKSVESTYKAIMMDLDARALSMYLMDDEEFLYRGSWIAQMEEPEPKSEIEEWKADMSMIFTEWTYLQMSLVQFHGYPDRLISGKSTTYLRLENYADKAMDKYEELEYTEETKEALEWASPLITQLMRNNVDILLGSTYEKNSKIKMKDEGKDND